MYIKPVMMISGALWCANHLKQNKCAELYLSLQKWIDSISLRNPKNTASLYSYNAVLLGTFAEEINIGRDKIEKYFVELFQKEGLHAKLMFVYAQPNSNMVSGTYRFIYNEGSVDARFTFVYHKGKIVNHHSSIQPS